MINMAEMVVRRVEKSYMAAHRADQQQLARALDAYGRPILFVDTGTDPWSILYCNSAAAAVRGLHILEACLLWVTNLQDEWTFRSSQGTVLWTSSVTVWSDKPLLQSALQQLDSAARTFWQCPAASCIRASSVVSGPSLMYWSFRRSLRRSDEGTLAP